ncbi:hypothetical protein FRC01_013004, partial [Tulasnella sp. 417]
MERLLRLAKLLSHHDPSTATPPDEIDGPAVFPVIAISLIALAVGIALFPRHPPLVAVHRVGRQLNYPVAALPPTGAHLEQRNVRLAPAPQANHRVHHDVPVAALPPPSPPPSPPPPYPEHILDPRIDGPAPSYSNIGSSQGRHYFQEPNVGLDDQPGDRTAFCVQCTLPPPSVVLPQPVVHITSTYALKMLPTATSASLKEMLLVLLSYNADPDG